jgi:hypothetical protein
VSLRGVIGSLNAATYSVQRRASGSYDEHGRYASGALTMLSIVADVQPMIGRDLEQLPEGERGNEAKLVITTTELRTRMPGADDASEYGGAGSEPDRVLIDGEWYVVTKVETWRSFGSVHYECVATRESKGA